MNILKTDKDQQIHECNEDVNIVNMNFVNTNKDQQIYEYNENVNTVKMWIL